MALSGATFSDFGGAVSDLFSASGDRFKAQGDLLEAQSYRSAAALARQNEAFTVESTGIQQAQQQRQAFLGIGSEQAAIAGSGLSEAGSALDLLRSSNQQAALQKAVLGQQGLITEASYDQQAKSFDMMASAADVAAQAANQAGQGADISALIKGAAGVGSLFF